MQMYIYTLRGCKCCQITLDKNPLMQISQLASYMVFSCSWCKKFRVISEIRCKGSAFICNLMANWKYFQLFIKNTAQSVDF